MSRVVWTEEKVGLLKEKFGEISVSQLEVELGVSAGDIEKFFRKNKWRISEFFKNKGLYTRNEMRKYLQLHNRIIDIWYGEKDFPKTKMYSFGKQVAVVKLEDFWLWMFQRRKTYNYKLISEQAIEEAPKCIRDLRKKCKTPKNHYAPWTQKENEYLEEFWGVYPMKKLIKEMGRTKASIINQVGFLGLPPAIESAVDMPCTELVSLMNYSPTIIKLWENKYGLPVKRKNISDSRVKQFISVESFWGWASKHKNIVDFTRFDIEVLPPVPKWAFEEKRKQQKELLAEKSHLREWTQEDEAKLILMRYVKKINYPTIAKELGRKREGVMRKYNALIQCEGFEEMVKKAKKIKYPSIEKYECNTAFEPKEWMHIEDCKLIYLSQIPQLDWNVIAKLVGTTRNIARRRYLNLKKSEMFENLKARAMSKSYPEFEGVIGEAKNEISGLKRNKHWRQEDTDKMLYLIAVCGIERENTGKVLMRSEYAVDYQYRKVKKMADFEARLRVLREKNIEQMNWNEQEKLRLLEFGVIENAEPKLNDLRVIKSWDQEDKVQYLMAASEMGKGKKLLRREQTI